MILNKDRARRALFYLTAPLLVAATSTAGLADFRPGRDAYLSGEYSRAYQLFLPSALQGDTKSRIGLGLLLARGDGLDADYIRSYAWHDAAVASGSGEHIVVQILARTNRDYLASRMTTDELAEGKLRSAMLQAIPERTDPRGANRRPAKTIRPMKASLKPATPDSGNGVMIAETGQPSRQYSIQLAALKAGHRTDLLTTWAKLVKRYEPLRKLEPTLVRLDLKNFGTYDGLRAGAFEDVGNALDTCAPLIADRLDCFVVAK